MVLQNMNTRITNLFKSLNTGFVRSIHFLYGLIIQPKSTTEDSRRHELILNIILTGFIGVLVFFDILLIISHHTHGLTHSGTPIGIFSIFIVIFSSLLILSRIGKFNIAAYSFISIFFLLVTYTMIHWGIEIPEAILCYVIIIVISSILINTKTSFVVTVIISTTVIVLGYFEIFGITHPYLDWKNVPILMNDAYEYAGAFILIAIISWLSNREIESSLQRARRSEQDLKQERDGLEIIVEERTRELKEAQAEKLAGLYRFAEFGRLSSGMFHDLMTPLSAVMANVERLERTTDNISETKRYLQMASNASKRMGSFLGAIRKQISPQSFNVPFSLNEQMRETIDMLKFKARTARVIIKLKESKNLTTFGNPLKFHQIILNLIANAIDACENHAQPEPLIIHIRISKFNGNAMIKITDHGSGIPAHLISKIFDPFFTTKPEHKGMGLGLSTTKQIVEKDFSGTLSVISNPHQGTTFTILIPLIKYGLQSNRSDSEAFGGTSEHAAT